MIFYRLVLGCLALCVIASGIILGAQIVDYFKSRGRSRW